MRISILAGRTEQYTIITANQSAKRPTPPKKILNVSPVDSLTNTNWHLFHPESAIKSQAAAINLHKMTPLEQTADNLSEGCPTARVNLTEKQETTLALDDHGLHLCHSYPKSENNYDSFGVIGPNNQVIQT